jgi:hypothetical protein
MAGGAGGRQGHHRSVCLHFGWPRRVRGRPAIRWRFSGSAMALHRCGSENCSARLADWCGRPTITEFVVWSAWWLALSVFVLLAAVGVHRAVRAFGAAAAAMDWRVPEGAQNLAMFGSGPPRVGARAVRPHELVADVDGHSQHRVEPVASSQRTAVAAARTSRRRSPSFREPQSPTPVSR